MLREVDFIGGLVLKMVRTKADGAGRKGKKKATSTTTQHASNLNSQDF